MHSLTAFLKTSAIGFALTSEKASVTDSFRYSLSTGIQNRPSVFPPHSPAAQYSLYSPASTSRLHAINPIQCFFDFFEGENTDPKTNAESVARRSFKIQYLTDIGKFSKQNSQPSLFSILQDPIQLLTINPVPDDWASKIKDLRDLGPYEVENYFVQARIAASDRQVVGHIFAPHQEQINDTPTPLVIVIPPGFFGGVDAPLNTLFFDIQFYESYMQHLASYGFTVFGLYESKGAIFSGNQPINHAHEATEISSLIDELLQNDKLVKTPLDPSKLAIMGHSKGAKVAYLTAIQDKRIGAILAIDPVNQGGPPSFISDQAYSHPVAPIPNRLSVDDAPIKDLEAAVCIFRAPPDMVNSESQFNAEHFWKGQKSDGIYIDLNVKHADWLFHRELQGGTRAVFAAWLFRHFSNHTDFDGYLNEQKIRSLLPHIEVNQIDEKPAPKE